jgi:POLQ-like helicase
MAPTPWPYDRRSAWIDTQRRTVAAYFKKRNIRVNREGYILEDRKAWEGNLVDASLKEWLLGLQAERQAAGGAFPIHKWIHHGLRSQALLINLLGPLLRAKRWDVMDAILKVAGLQFAGSVVKVDLEREDRAVFNERQGQPTSFDLACETDAGERAFIEFKFTEAEFGGCSVFDEGDCDGANAATDHSLCYLHHIGRRYWDAMDRHGLTTAISRDTTCPFAHMYQAYRELLFALERGGKYVLVYDARNTAFVSLGAAGIRGSWSRLLDALPQGARAMTGPLTIQLLVALLERLGCQWIAELREKHGFQ